MKKVIGILCVVALLLGVASVAMATSASNWVVSLQAYGMTAGGAAQDSAWTPSANVYAGTWTGYTDACDTNAGLDWGAEPLPVAGAMGSYLNLVAQVDASNAGALDLRAPINGNSETWTFKLNYAGTTSAAADTRIYIFGGDMAYGDNTCAPVYTFGGKDYQYVFTGLGASPVIFDKNHQFSTAIGTDGLGVGTYFDVACGSASSPTVITMKLQQVPSTPEPGSMLALGSGLVGLVGFAIRRKR